MNTEIAMLYGLVALSSLSALGILLIRNVFYAAFLLLICLISVAGIFLLLQAEFLAATQIIIYAGGVLVLIIFGIMLTRRLSGKAATVLHQNYVAGSFVAASLLAVLLYSLAAFKFSPGVNQQHMTHHVNQVGLSLFTQYVAPFEVAGLLLLISLIAAAVIASQIQPKRNP